MLKLFRHKNVAKIVLWGLLILILPAFVLWGTGSLSGSKGKGPKYVGKIHGRKVSFDEFAQSMVNARCQLILNYYNQPKILDGLLANESFMGRLGWDRLIMVREAGKAGIRISDKEVINYIKSLPVFLRDGKFDERFYQYILRNNLGMAPRGFEELVRENLEMRKLNDNLTKDIKVTELEVADAYRSEIQKPDEEKFKKEKEEYSKRALKKKREAHLSEWLGGLESQAQLNIDLGDYEKYYR